MDTRIYILTGLLSLLVLASCKREELAVYQDETNIYFDAGDDTLGISFSADTLATYTFRLPVRIMGRLTPSPRPFRLEVDADSTTAVLGRDYLMPADSLLTIGGDSAVRNLRVVVLRSQALRNSTVTLLLKLHPNDAFHTNISTSLLRYKVVISDIMDQPEWWDAYSDLLGPFSRKKVELLMPMMQDQLSLNDFLEFGNYYPGILSDAAGKLHQYLDEMKAKGQTIYEEDGTEMEMGPDAG